MLAVCSGLAAAELFGKSEAKACRATEPSFPATLGSSFFAPDLLADNLQLYLGTKGGSRTSKTAY